ncbi:hypothetical protein [Sphingobium sp. BS19]|uniref:hypothetical protein n=1 Tax=Sphingobium sp. BS19 TaxID=3018973 RepID=UPI0024935CF3|nr:hypothetical protein [Sphingobium sp. BS19]
MDPTDILDFYFEISQGDATGDILMTGEEIASFTLGTTAEATAGGVRIMSDGVRAPIADGRIIRFWMDVDPTTQSSTIFDSRGILVGIVLTITTDADPLRKKQRTVGIRVANQ